MPPIRPELLDDLLRDYKKPDDLLGQAGLLQQLTKALVERALDGELTHHLDYERNDSSGDNSGNSRNGRTPKTIRGKRRQVQIRRAPRPYQRVRAPARQEVAGALRRPRREPHLPVCPRHDAARDTRALGGDYGVEVSPSLITTVTDAVLGEVRAWQSRVLDSVYPILYLDALQVKVKSQGRMVNKAIYIAFGVRLQGLKEVLGMWAAEAEGAKFWMQVVTELKNGASHTSSSRAWTGSRASPRR